MFLCKLFEDNQRTSSGISGVLKNMHRLYVPMYYNDKLYGVQITVKESKSKTTIGDKKSNNKIYSLEAVDVENLFDKSQEEWKKEYIRRNEKYLNKKDFEMGGDLPIQNGASSSPNSYELFSKSAVTFFETIINVNKKSDNARFSSV